MRFAVCFCLRCSSLRSPRSHSSMNPVKPSSFGWRTGAVRRYPGGTENSSIFLTLSREIPKWRAAARSLIPSRHARRTLRYSSIRFAARRLACESSRPPHNRKGLPDWQSFAPPQRDHPAATVVYSCTAVCRSGVIRSSAAVVTRADGSRVGAMAAAKWDIYLLGGVEISRHTRFSCVIPLPSPALGAPVAVFQLLRVTLVARVAARGNMPTRGERRVGPRRREPDLRADKVTPCGGLGR